MEQTVKMNHLLVLSEQLYKRISESENKNLMHLTFWT